VLTCGPGSAVSWIVTRIVQSLYIAVVLASYTPPLGITSFVVMLAFVGTNCSNNWSFRRRQLCDLLIREQRIREIIQEIWLEC
jgi:hypothetical protein